MLKTKGNKLSNKNDKLKLIEFILDELNIKSFRGPIANMLLKKLSHRNLSDLVVGTFDKYVIKK